MHVARLEQPNSAVPAFTGMALDRASTERKDPEWIERQLSAPGSRAVLVSGEAILIERDTVARVPLVRPWPQPGEPILLGVEGGRAVFAFDLEIMTADLSASLQRNARMVGLREAGAELRHAEGGLAAYAVAMVNWHRRHRFCANCGTATVAVEGGYVRRCPHCGGDHFPRTDPVVIMLVEHQGRLLLGRRNGWPALRYSALAGFVSPGESVEEAVVREVWEESGITARDPEFVSSQPWPFPSSLMLGFEAASPGGRPVARDGELEDVRWFSRDEIQSAVSGTNGALLLPPAISIARFLIERWAAHQRYRG